MLWNTLNAVRSSVHEFSASSGLRERHHFVRLASGRWTRTLGVPENAINVGGHVWHVKGGK